MKYLENIISKPIFVDWAITNKCYLSCAHCRYRGVDKQKNQELKFNEALELATEIDAINPDWILIEGGEPFLRDNIFDIIRYLKPRIDTDAHGLKKEHNLLNQSNPWLESRPIYIISSGLGFYTEYAHKCKEMDIRLMISLDSAIKETYEKIRVGAMLSKAIRAIEIAQEYNILDSINVTLQELNASEKEVTAIGKLSNELKIKSINFLGFKPNSACAKNSLLTFNLQHLFSEITNIGEKYNIKVKVDEPFYLPWLKKSQVKAHSSRTKENKGPIVAEKRAGCIFGEYVFIEPDGRIKPCSFSVLSFDEIGIDTIKQIQDKRNRKGKCGKCEYQLQCGGCRVRTFALTSNWLESDPFCPL